MSNKKIGVTIQFNCFDERTFFINVDPDDKYCVDSQKFIDLLVDEYSHLGRGDEFTVKIAD
tara:strand:+ start:2301 stop:2483 length:183 start_codon:yes stop_codon:yes gene_type:complete